MKASGQSALEYLSTYAWAIIAVAIVIGVLIFVTSSSLEPRGNLYIYLTDATVKGLESLKITFSSIEIHKDGQWSIFSNEEKTFDLMQLSSKKTLLGAKQFPLGKYTQVRLDVRKAEAIINGEPCSVEVPSEKIYLVHSFDVKFNSDTYLILDFTPESLKIAGGKCILSPVIKVRTEMYLRGVDLCLGRICPEGQECSQGQCIEAAEKTIASFADGATEKILGFQNVYSEMPKTFQYLKIPPNASITLASMRVGCYSGSVGLGGNRLEEDYSLKLSWGVGISESINWKEGKMVKGVEYAVGVRAYNSGDHADTYAVRVEEEGADVSDSFEVRYSENTFEIPANSNKRIWVYLTPKKSEGEHMLYLKAYLVSDGRLADSATARFYVTLLGKDCPDDPSTDVGNDGSREWSYSGELSSAVTIDFSDGLKQAIASCNNFGLCSSEPYLTPVPPLLGGYYPCINAEGKCLIPVIFGTQDSGVFKVSNIRITYTEQQ